jgi:formate--tetrahydrofolate ligase
MKTDIEIAQEAKLKPITEIAKELGLSDDDLKLYGKYIAKISLKVLKRLKGKPNGKLVVVTAITPTKAGEGKTVLAIGLAQSFAKLGKKSIVCIREPSMGPTFGIKGGACGGGYAQVLPMEEINLLFTGDIPAIERAHNLLAEMLDTHILKGNRLGIDPYRITLKRVMDCNARHLRHVIIGLGGATDGVPRESGFDITVASETAAIHALARDLPDLKERLSKMLIAYTRDGRVVTPADLKAVGAMALIMKDSIKPNLVQTIENTPAFVHGTPFANIAHGCPSVASLIMALKLADYVTYEVGFGSDEGAEKFYDIVCPLAGLKPDVELIVVSIRALKVHGGAPFAETRKENLEALSNGIANLKKHLEIAEKFGVPAVVAINRFPSDTEAELRLVKEECRKMGVPSSIVEVHAKGGEGGLELAREIIRVIERRPSNFHPLYDAEKLSIKEKLERLTTEVYGGDGVTFSDKAEQSIATLEKLGLDKMPICVAKTQYSLSDDPNKLGVPTGWKLKVDDVWASVGAGFLVALCGAVRTMPGLPEPSAAQGMDIDENERITGLF